TYGPDHMAKGKIWGTTLGPMETLSVESRRTFMSADALLEVLVGEKAGNRGLDAASGVPVLDATTVQLEFGDVVALLVRPTAVDKPGERSVVFLALDFSSTAPKQGTWIEITEWARRLRN